MASITQDGKAVHTPGDLPGVGELAPAFTATGLDLNDLSLGDFAGQKVVLNIFPSVETGICAATVRYFNEAAAEIPDVKVLTISMDTPFALKRFRAAEGIDAVVLMSGIRSNLGKDYNVSLLDGPFAGLYSRVVMVLNEEQRVVYTEQVPDIGAEPDYEAALAALEG